MPWNALLPAIADGGSLWPTILVLLKATTILAAGLAITLALHRANASTRHVVWLVALGGVLVLPLIAVLSPVRLPVLPATASDAPLTAPLGGAAALPPETVTPRAASDPAPLPPVSRQDPVTASIGAGSIVLGLWAAVSLLLLGRLLHGVWAVRRIVRRAVPLDDGAWQESLYEIADRLGLDEAPRLLRSTDIHMPFAAGMRRATVVLPAACDTWSPAQREAVLIHELGHVRRRDIAGHMLGRIACALYWFHPLVWTGARRLRDASERACDDLAIRLGATPSEYAQHLLDIVTAVRHPRTPTAAIAMARRKEFEGRMLAILDPALRRTDAPRWRTALLTTGLALFVFAVSAAAPAPRATTPSPVASDTERPEAPPPALADNTEQSRMGAPTRDVARRNDSRDADAASGAVRIDHNAIMAQVRQSLGIDTEGALDPDKLDVLIGILRDDQSAEVRRVAAWGMQRYAGESRARQALATALRNDADADVRQMAAWSLAHGDGADVVAALGAAFSNDQDADVREMAAWGLGVAGDPASAPTITGHLPSETSAEVRATAAWALGTIAPATAPPSLIALLRDASSDVRLPAAWALSQIGDEAALPAITAALDGENDEETLRALLRAMVRSGATPESLSRFLSSANPEVRIAAVRSMTGAGGVEPWPWPAPRPIPIP